VIVYASCFINSAAAGADFGELAALTGIFVAGLLAYFSHRQRGIA
jgi:hypothetical protein